MIKTFDLARYVKAFRSAETVPGEIVVVCPTEFVQVWLVRRN